MAEQVQLGKFLLERLSTSHELENLSTAQRMRMSFEELGPTFVKLGQLLATRPDLVPEDWVTEFEKLHASVQPLTFEVIEGVLKEEFGEELYQKFSEFDPTPLGSASIAQAHKARLKDGTLVVVKVQRPGIVQLINDDLNVLYFIAELLEYYVEEVRTFNPLGVVDEYFKTLELETNFLVEANNIRRFAENFKTDPHIKIPRVYLELTTERVLTLEHLDGIPLSSPEALKQPGLSPSEVIRRGLGAYLKMVFKDGLFHGDLHAGNFFVSGNSQIGLIDFGVVGRLSRRAQNSIANMLVALATEDYERLAHEYVDMAPFDERTNVDRFARELRDVVAPYFGLTLKNVNFGKVLMSTAAVSSRNNVALPTDMMLFFKSIVSIEGLARRIIKDFDFLTYSMEFATELAKTQYDPNRLMGEMTEVLRDSKTLLAGLPRQLKQMLRKFNSPDFAVKIEINDLGKLNQTLERSGLKIYWGLVIAALIIAAAVMMNLPHESSILGINPLSFAALVLALVFGNWTYWFKR